MSKASRREPIVLPDLQAGWVPQLGGGFLPKWADAGVNKEEFLREAAIGSPGFDPSPEQAAQVEQMAALGMSDNDIGAVLKIEPKLLKKYYDYELNTAAARINQKVSTVALQMALSGAMPDMTKFWLETRAGWKKTVVKEVTGAGGGPIQFAEVKQRMLDAIEAEFTEIKDE